MRSFILLFLASILAVASAARMSCANQGLLKKPKPPRLGPGCDPSRSKGFVASHNCPGRAYLCVIGGVATCYEGKSIVGRLTAENGECFL